MLEAGLAHIRNFQPVGKYGMVSSTQNPAKAHRNYPRIIPERILAGTDRFKAISTSHDTKRTGENTRFQNFDLGRLYL